jgi:hypothetical protein
MTTTELEAEASRLWENETAARAALRAAKAAYVADPALLAALEAAREAGSSARLTAVLAMKSAALAVGKVRAAHAAADAAADRRHHGGRQLANTTDEARWNSQRAEMGAAVAALDAAAAARWTTPEGAVAAALENEIHARGVAALAPATAALAAAAAATSAAQFAAAQFAAAPEPAPVPDWAARASRADAALEAARGAGWRGPMD